MYVYNLRGFGRTVDGAAWIPDLGALIIRQLVDDAGLVRAGPNPGSEDCL